MKFVLWTASWVLVIMVLSSFITLGFGASVQHGITFHGTSSQMVQVWFDACPQLTTSYPPAYLFNVAAKTSGGLSITSLHWDFGDGSSLDVPFSGQSQVSDIRAHQYVNQANYIVTVTAYDSAGNIATVRVSLLPDFTLTPASPTSQNITQGGSASYIVNVGSAWCNQIHIDLATSLNQNPPPGITWILTPPSGNTNFTSILQINTTTTTPKGIYTIEIIGTGAGVTHTFTVTLGVKAPYFAISVAPNSLSVSAQVRTNTTTVTIQSVNGFNSPVALTASGNPSGMIVSFSPPTVTPPPNGKGNSIANITVECIVTPGTYAIAINGTGGGLARQSYVNVKVAACSTPQEPPWWLIVVLIGAMAVVALAVVLTRDRQPNYHY